MARFRDGEDRGGERAREHRGGVRAYRFKLRGRGTTARIGRDDRIARMLRRNEPSILFESKAPLHPKNG